MINPSSPPRRICILTDGYLDVFTAKTALGLLRYCPAEIVAVVDADHAGKEVADLFDLDVHVPIVATVDDALRWQPDWLAIGAAFAGGAFPDAWRQHLRTALQNGLDVLNGLHTRLAADDELAALAGRLGREIVDVRQPPPVRAVGTGQARTTHGRRILTVGTDCNLGKRVTALELTRALQQRGRSAEYVATGQTGVMIARSGVVIDAVVSDFLSGVVERIVLEKSAADYIIVEGQGSLTHPSFSAVTLGLMHGAMPDALILCHAPARQHMRHTQVPCLSPAAMIALSEAVMAPLHPTRAIGVALNCHGLSAAAADAAVEQVHAETGLPVTDPIRLGVEPLVEAVEAFPP